MSINFILRTIVFSCRFSFLRRPNWIGYLFYRAIRSVSQGNWHKKAKYTLLVLPRSGLVEDVQAALGDKDDYRILQAPVGLMKSVVYSFLPKTIDDNNYYNLSAAEEKAKLEYRAFMTDVLLYLRQKIQLDAMTTANFAYFAEREVHAAASDAQISFVVIHKESLKSSGRREYFETTYREKRGEFGGQKILVYNQLEKDIQVKSKVVSPDKIEVCGMPRLDRNHAWRLAHTHKKNAAKPNVLFLLFGVKTGLPVRGRKIAGAKRVGLTKELEKLNWNKTFEVTIQGLLEFAQENPNVNINIKAKLAMADIIADVEKIAEDAMGRLPANVRIIPEGDPFDLMKDAWVVFGMNSTALLEAMAMGKNVISPFYAEAAEPEMQAWIADFGKSLTKVRSKEELQSTLGIVLSGEAPVTPEELSDDVIEQLDYWTGNADGLAGQRVYEAFGAAIKERGA